MVLALQWTFVLSILGLIGGIYLIYNTKYSEEFWKTLGFVLVLLCTTLIFLGFIIPIQYRYQPVLRSEYEIVKSSDTLWIEYKDIKAEFTDAKSYNSIDKKSSIFIRDAFSTIGILLARNIVLEKDE